MQVEVILFITLAWFSTCERCRQGTTVLTDESKRVMDQFDFSGFDKQEALNYIDMHRYENQIRGKRSGINLIEKDIVPCSDGNKKDRDINRRLALPSGFENSPRTKKMIRINDLITRLKRKINEVEIYMKHSNENEMNRIRHKRGQNKIKKKKKLKKYADEELDGEEEDEEEKITKKKKKKRHWSEWTEWSPCSVTCGRGRRIRWRKCIAKVCDTGELEMGEKTCQLPACNILSKFLDILN